MVNGPPGTSTSDGNRNASAGAGPGEAAASTGAPPPEVRIWWVISIVSSCCTSCWAIIPNANPSLSSRGPVKGARSSRSSTRPRTSCP